MLAGVWFVGIVAFAGNSIMVLLTVVADVVTMPPGRVTGTIKVFVSTVVWAPSMCSEEPMAAQDDSRARLA